MKEAFHIEYSMKKGSKKVLWSLLSTPNGLSEWFADRVDRNGNIFTFTWKKSSEQATLLQVVPEDSIRFHWMHDTEDCFFELKILYSELTGEISLYVTDYAEPGEEDDVINLWDSDIDRLTRRIGL